MKVKGRLRSVGVFAGVAANVQMRMFNGGDLVEAVAPC